MIARNWQCKPFEVDLAPSDEVALELQLMDLEREVSEWNQRNRG